MKKLLVLLSFIFLLASCGKEDKNTLCIYGWADYIPKELYSKFEKETGIKIVEDSYASNEEMFAKIKNGATGYDILMPSTDYAEIMINNNMLEKIDKNKISTFKNIDPIVLEKMRYFDKNNEYAIPYVMGATAIAVNTKYVKNIPEDFSIYNNPQYKGKMTLLNDMREVMTSALGMLGYKQDTTNPKEIEEAKKLIMQWKQNIAKFDAESFGKGYANEDFWIVHCYPDNVLNELTEEQKKNTKFIIPKKGGTSYIDSFVILKDAPHKEAAYKFIEFIHRPENYKLIAEKIKVPSINVPARQLITIQPIYTIDDLKNTEILRDIKNSLELQNNAWQEISVE